MVLAADGRMTWEGSKHNFGSRRDRHRLRRFLRDRVAQIPVTVRISMSDSPRPFTFAPAYVNGQYRFVCFTYRLYIVLMKYDDVAPWIRDFIHTNHMFEQPYFHHVIHNIVDNPL